MALPHQLRSGKHGGVGTARHDIERANPSCVHVHPGAALAVMISWPSMNIRIRASLLRVNRSRALHSIGDD
ncbi:hypothetical protein [Caballeronia sp. ATUFL_M2_KS44]|uniref:hypothetical protein n=1 Tax=Caballeronia sp. ATUFL_M2_KS44 TaxID=2921767 RepID=UPI002028658B|nr:hypothetical protein [Caballeronia sp. ATUFL_M2_KS44]